MNSRQGQALVEQMLALWPSPAMTDEEAVGWAAVLTDPELDMSFTEVSAVCRRISFSGDVHRPRPGQVVAAVKAERRARARVSDTSRMLAAGRDGAVDGERTRQWVRTCRRVLAGTPLDDAKRMEGVA